mgnify:CR=1 FL=1
MNKKNKIKVLFLSAWYPNRYDAMAGLFVRKHAEAVSLYCDVTVLYLHGDKNIKDAEIVYQTINPNAREIIVYYPEKRKGILRKFIKIFNYFHANFIGYKEVKKTVGVPDIAHVNVLTRTGLLAYWLKKTKNIPYVITEHWTRYLPSRNSYNGFLRKAISKRIVKNASAVMPVSEDLMQAMKSHGLFNNNYLVVNNVVDDFFFQQSENVKNNRKFILHVSCFDDEQKNISGILRVVKKLSTIRNDFTMTMVGTGIDFEDLVNYAKELNIPNEVIRFTGELSPVEVAKEFHLCDFFVLFSNHENSPVVICESLCCGKPVLSTDVGGISELVNNKNGILIAAQDEIALELKINHMLDYYQHYDTTEIKQSGIEKFSYKSIGNKINYIYINIIKHEKKNHYPNFNK